MTTESLSAAPGWYPDGLGATRYFDGSAWTTHTQPLAPQAPPAAAAVPAAAAGSRAASREADAPFYRQGWFVVDALVLAGIALVIFIATIT